MPAKQACLISSVTSITPEEFQKAGCNFRIKDEWARQMAFILVIKMPEYGHEGSHSPSHHFV